MVYCEQLAPFGALANVPASSSARTNAEGLVLLADPGENPAHVLGPGVPHGAALPAFGRGAHAQRGRIMRMSKHGGENVFRTLRWPDGKPVCPRCGCAICYECRWPAEPRWRKARPTTTYRKVTGGFRSDWGGRPVRRRPLRHQHRCSPWHQCLSGHPQYATRSGSTRHLIGRRSCSIA